MRLCAPILLCAAPLALALAGCASSHGEARSPAAAPAPLPTIGGAAIDPAATIAANVVKAPNLAIFVKTMRAAGLEQTLASAGPYTVLAPTDDAFGRLGVLAGWRTEARIAFNVDRNAFTPPPKVTSSVVQLKPRPVDAGIAVGITIFLTHFQVLFAEILCRVVFGLKQFYRMQEYAFVFLNRAF